VFFESANKPAYTKLERRGIYDSIMEKVERILSSMKQSGQAIRELAWRIALESWLRSKGYIKVYINASSIMKIKTCQVTSVSIKKGLLQPAPFYAPMI